MYLVISMGMFDMTEKDLIRYGKAWDSVLDTLFFGHKPVQTIDNPPDDETYCALYCKEERREWEDCALVGGCPLGKEGVEP
jgi:hypothetical protein